MSLLKMLTEGDIGKLASSLNMDAGKASELTKMLAPTIGSAAKKRAEAGDAESVLNELRGEQSSTFFDTPERAATPEAMDDGNAFLERLLGSHEAKSEVAAEAAARAGASKEEVENFMPALAAMLKGGMQKKTPDSSIDGLLAGLTGGGTAGAATGAGGAEASSGGGGLMGMLGGLLGGGNKGGESAGGAGGFDLSSITSMLDADGDGSPLDDILEKVMKR